MGAVSVAGADVWAARWVVVVLAGGAFESAQVTDGIDEAVDRMADAQVIGVDMPIGLPGPGERRPCDELARRFVGPRRSSVFWTPCRDLLEAPTYAAACALARARGWPGIAAQTYALKRQILAVERVAAHDDRLVEVHPEVSFAEAKGTVLSWPKTSWNGMQERQAILRSRGIDLPPLSEGLGRAGTADVLDAAIVAWSAWRVATGGARSLPDGPDGATGGSSKMWR